MGMYIEVAWFVILVILGLLIYQEYAKYACKPLKYNHKSINDIHTSPGIGNQSIPPITRHYDNVVLEGINDTVNDAVIYTPNDTLSSQHPQMKGCTAVNMHSPNDAPSVHSDTIQNQNVVRYVPLRDRADQFKKERLDSVDPTTIDIGTHRRNMSNVLSWGLKQDSAMVDCSTSNSQ